MKVLWLDDFRDPFASHPNKEEGQTWADAYLLSIIKNKAKQLFWVKNYDQFIQWITANGLPDIICFDHDLGEADEKSGYDAAKWLVDYCLDKEELCPDWIIQSSNPAGKENINGLLNNLEKFQKSLGNMKTDSDDFDDFE